MIFFFIEISVLIGDFLIFLRVRVVVGGGFVMVVFFFIRCFGIFICVVFKIFVVFVIIIVFLFLFLNM